MASKPERRVGGGDDVGEPVHEVRRARDDHVLGANGAQQLLLVRAAHDIDERYAVLPADPHQHLAEVRRGGGVHQPDVAFRAHRLDE